MIDSRDNRFSLKAMRIILRILSYIMPSLFWKISSKLFFYPNRPALRDQDKKRLNEARQLISPKWLMAWQFGDHKAPAIALLHGWSMRGSHMLPYVEPLIAKGYRVIVVDLPAHGASAGQISSVPQAESYLHSWLAAQGNVIGIIGHSFGGVLALRASYQEVPVENIVAIATPQRYIYPEFRDHMRFNQRMDRQFRERADNMIGADILEQHTLNVPVDYTTQVRYIQAKDDFVVAREQPLRMAELIPNGEFIEVDKGGHLKIIWEKETLQLAVDRFPNIQAKH